MAINIESVTPTISEIWTMTEPRVFQIRLRNNGSTSASCTVALYQKTQGYSSDQLSTKKTSGAIPPKTQATLSLPSVTPLNAGDDILTFKVNGVSEKTMMYTIVPLVVNSNPNYPSNPATACASQYKSSVGYRSAYAYAKVIDQFNVETRSRYQPGGGKTYCNIFAWDVTSAMNCEIPHWVDSKEQNANANYDWLVNGNGGWYSVTESTALSNAKKGIPTVVAWKNTDGGSGHIAVVRPTNGSSVRIAQAGATNYSDTSISTGFGSKSPLKYFSHA